MTKRNTQTPQSLVKDARVTPEALDAFDEYLTHKIAEAARTRKSLGRIKRVEGEDNANKIRQYWTHVESALTYVRGQLRRSRGAKVNRVAATASGTDKPA